MNNDTKTFDYKFRLLPNYKEVCATAREAELYNKYFPVLKRCHGDTILTPGVYQVTVVEKDGFLQLIDIKPSRYTFKEIWNALTKR